MNARAEETPRDAWLRARRECIGSSDVAPILGLSPFRTIHDVYAEKVGRSKGQRDAARMQWGKRLEPVIVQWWADEAPARILRPDEVNLGDRDVQWFEHGGGRPFAFVRHPSEPWLACSPDDFAEPLGGGVLLVEAKSAEVFKRDSWGLGGQDAGDGVVPDEYMVQVQHQLFVAGMSDAVMVAAIGLGDPPRSYPVGYDSGFYEGRVLPRLRAFWRLVQNRTPPAADGSAGADRMLHALYPQATGDPMVLADDAAELLVSYETARAEKAKAHAEAVAAGKRMELAEQQIKELMGDAPEAVLDSWAVGWSNRKGARRVDLAALKAKHPAIHAECTKQGDPTRVFSVTRMS